MVNLFRDMGSSDDWPRSFDPIAKSLGVYPSPPRKPNLQIPEFYEEFFTKKLDFAILPRKGHRPLSAASESDEKSKAWQRICGRVAESVRNQKWFHKDLADAIGIAFAQLFHRTGHCGLPLYVRLRAAEQLFAMRTIVSERRTQTTHGSMDSQNAERREYYEAAKWNLGRARRRLACEHAKVGAGSEIGTRDEKGNI